MLAREYSPYWDLMAGFEPRVAYLGHYGDVEASNFVTYLCHKWKVKIDTARKLELCRWSGGNLAILKGVVWRELECGGGELDISDISLLRQCECYWNGLVESEQMWLRFTMFERNLPVELRAVRSYFEAINLLDEKGVIRTQWLVDYVKQYQKDPSGVELAGEQVMIAGVDYTHLFNKRQRKWIRALMAKPRQIVSREQLMEMGWGDEGVSDWALDSQLMRLRKLLDEIGVGARHLVTKRGKGVLWQ